MLKQLDIDLRLSTGRPLAPLEAGMFILNRDEDDVLNLAERGLLAWCWDIRTPDAERRELRIWRDSILAYSADQELTVAEDEVYASLFPHRRDVLRSTELQHIFCASQRHIQRLIDAKLIPAIGHGGEGTHRPLHGPNSFSRVRRADVITFLKSRTWRDLR